MAAPKDFTSDLYNVQIVKKMTRIAPIVGLCAAVTFTLARVFGLYTKTSLLGLILFDLNCCAYPFIGLWWSKRGIVKDGRVDEKKESQVQYTLVILSLLQWNLISYIFPSNDIWGFAALYLLLTAIFFDTRLILIEAGGLLISMMVSWNYLDALLPVRDELFTENLIMRVVALLLIFVMSYLIVRNGEKFKSTMEVRSRQLNVRNTELRALNDDIIDFAANMVENRDPEIGTHIKRVKKYSGTLAACVKEMCPSYRLNDVDVARIARASVLHDLGKIQIPDSVLLKPTRLTDEEFEIIKTHAKAGADIVDTMPTRLDANFIRCAKEICLYHHERYDGKGYPFGLKGEEIPISAQIVSLVDCYDALTTKRAYKDALPKDVAVRMIVNGECGQFQEQLLKCFEKCFAEDGLD